jgi:hypothetical protein
VYYNLTLIILVDGKNPSIACATTGGKVYVHQAFKNGGESDLPAI